MSTEDFGISRLQGRNEIDREEWIETTPESTTMELICTKLKDQNYDACEIMRLVTYVVAILAMQILKLGVTAEEFYFRRSLSLGITALRELRRSIRDSHSLRKTADVILWEGEAIKHHNETVAHWFTEAMQKAGLEKSERDIVWRNYRDLATVNEPQLRRETGG